MLLNLMDNLKRKDGQNKPLLTASKLYVHEALSSIFKHATEWNVIKTNPMRNVKKLAI